MRPAVSGNEHLGKGRIRLKWTSRLPRVLVQVKKTTSGILNAAGQPNVRRIKVSAVSLRTANYSAGTRMNSNAAVPRTGFQRTCRCRRRRCWRTAVFGSKATRSIRDQPRSLPVVIGKSHRKLAPYLQACAHVIIQKDDGSKKYLDHVKNSLWDRSLVASTTYACVSLKQTKKSDLPWKSGE